MALTTPLGRRDFRLLWAGMSVSLVGDGVFIVAVAWQAYAVSNQPSSLAYVGLANALPQIALLLVGGAVSDRMDRQRVLAMADIVRATAVGLLALLTALGTLRLWELLAVAGIIGTATAFASPALDALVPQLVPESELTQANALDQVVRPLAVQLAGPALGGLAVAVVQPAGAFALDAVTFLLSAVCIIRMTPLQLSVDIAQIGSLRHEVREGLRYVRRHVWLWGTFFSATFAYLLFIGPTQVLLPYIVRNSLHAGASTYGIVLAPEPVYREPRDAEWAYLVTGFSECIDSFFAFGLFEVARRSGFFPAGLVDTFEPVIQEEARHILLFANWLAWHRRRQTWLRRVWFEARVAAVWVFLGWERIGIARGMDTGGAPAADNNFTLTGGKSVSDEQLGVISLMGVCLAENDRRFALYDRRLVRPTTTPAIARVVHWVGSWRERFRHGTVTRDSGMSSSR